MRKQFLVAFTNAAILLLFATMATALAADSRDGILYDVSAERVFVGTVHEMPSEFEGWMYFTLWTGDGAVAMQMGPKDFVTRSGFKLKGGQMVTVTGMRIVINHREMVLAREIVARGAVFVARDRSGRPLWESDRPVDMDPDLGVRMIPVC